jgi:hypothetical protein
MIIALSIPPIYPARTPEIMLCCLKTLYLVNKLN